MPLSRAAKQQRYRKRHLGVDGLTRSQVPDRRHLSWIAVVSDGWVAAAALGQKRNAMLFTLR
jgi:hypothetical protein